MMKSGVLLSDDVVEELDCDPAVDCGRIAVGVRDGVVTLLGSVPGFWQKDRAEDAVRQVMGVRALANDLKVLLRGTHVRNGRSRNGAQLAHRPAPDDYRDGL